MQIAGWLATCATGSYVQQDSSGVERASWLLRMPFWLEANYIFLRSSHFVSLSSSSGLPTLFRDHHLFTSTAANHGSTNTSASWAWNRIEQNDRRFCQYPTRWNPTTMQTPICSLRRCKCSHQNMTLDAQLKIVHITGSSKNKKQHVIGYEYSQIEVDDRQLML